MTRHASGHSKARYTLSSAAIIDSHHLPTGISPYRFDAQRAPIDFLNGNPSPIRDRLAGLKKPLAAVIDRSLVRNPNDRFQDAGKLLAAIPRARP